MKYESERIYLRAWTAEDALLLQHFQLRNREQIESITANKRAGFHETGSHDVPIQDVMKKHIMLTISLGDTD